MAFNRLGANIFCAASALLLIAGNAAAQTPVSLGTASGYAVLAGSAVTNTGPSVVTGDLGLSPGTAVTGFAPGNVIGTIRTVAAAAPAQADLITAYNDDAGRSPVTTVSTELADRLSFPASTTLLPVHLGLPGPSRSMDKTIQALSLSFKPLLLSLPQQALRGLRPAGLC